MLFFGLSWFAKEGGFCWLYVFVCVLHVILLVLLLGLKENSWAHMLFEWFSWFCSGCCLNL